MHEVVIAAVHLPNFPVGPKVGRDVEDGLELLGHDVVAQHLGPVPDVDGVGTSRAEVPALAGVIQKLTAGREQRTDFRNGISGFVQLEEGRARPTPVVGKSQEDQHLITVLMGIRIPPVGIADIPDAIQSAAVRGIRDPHGLGVVRRRKCERSPRWRYE